MVVSPRRVATTVSVFALVCAGCFSDPAPADGDDSGATKDLGLVDDAAGDAGATEDVPVDAGAIDAPVVDAGFTDVTDAASDASDADGDAGDAPCSPELCPPSTGRGARSLVSAGGVMSSPRFRMVSTLGDVSATRATMSSARFRLHGGLVRTTGGAR